MKKILQLYITIGMIFGAGLHAQTSSFSLGELNPYFSEYLRPLAVGMATGMGHGWAHQAHPHGKFGFDVSLSFVAVQVPASDMSFSAKSLDEMTSRGYQFLSNNASNTPLSATATLPTILSSEGSSAVLLKDIGTDIKFDLLDGLMSEDIAGYVPNFALQFAFGLPKGTEVIGRFLPDMSSTLNDKLGSEDINIKQLNMWGIGVKHDIKQWIPVLKETSILQMSALLSYSKFNLDVASSDFALSPEDLISDINVSYDDINNDGQAPHRSSDFDGLGFGMHMNSWVGSLLIGAKIPVIHPFIGVGFNRVSVNTGLTGDLPMIEYKNSSEGIVVDYDPVGLNLDEAQSFVNFQTGINLKLAFLKIHAQYTFQKYSMFSAGVSLGIDHFRKL